MILPGQVREPSHAIQPRDFSGLAFGAITPTDLDAVIEVQDRAFVFIEAKYRDASLPRGQELALERLCDTCTSAGKQALCVVARHETAAPAAIEFGSAVVDRYRIDFQWHRPRREASTVRQIVDWFRTTRVAGW